MIEYVQSFPKIEIFPQWLHILQYVQYLCKNYFNLNLKLKTKFI